MCINGVTTLLTASNELDKVASKSDSFLAKLFPYFGVKKKAVDCYIDDIKKSALSPETKAMAIMQVRQKFKEINNQSDIVSIAIDYAKDGTDFSDESKVNDEWLDRYMDSAKFVSNEEMKLIWGKILANEFETPGSTPLNMSRILSETSPELAEAFTKICSMKVIIHLVDRDGKENDYEDCVIIPFSGNEEFFSDQGIHYSTLLELETAGLIKQDSDGYALNIRDQNFIKYRIEGFDDLFSISGQERQISIGNVALTAAGRCLEEIIEEKEINGYDEVIMNFYRGK